MMGTAGRATRAGSAGPIAAAAAHPEDKWIYVVLCVVLALFLSFGLVEVYSVGGLFSYDPYYHMNLSELTERNQEIVTSIKYYEESGPPQYLTSMQPLTVLIHEFTGLSYITIYRTFGLFCRLFTALALFVAAGYFLGSRRYALIAVILFLSAPYIFYRSLISFPENLVLPFHILIFNSMIHSLREKRTDFALPAYISAALYIHYRSIIIPALLLLVFVVFRRSIKYAVGLCLGTAALAAPILLSAFNQYATYSHVNIGSGATWKPYTVSNPSYTVPTFNYYLSQLGVLLVLLALLGIPLLLRRINAEKLLLLLWLALTFILTRGQQVGLYIPTDRMIAYLCVPAALTSALFVKEIMEPEFISSRARLAAACLVSLAMVFFLVVGLPAIHGWVGVAEEKLDATRWLNENVSQDAVIVSYDLDLTTMGVDKYGNIDFLGGDDWEAVFNAPQGVRGKIGEIYPGKEVYIISGTPDFQIHDAQVVFYEGKTKIYYYQSG
jgi:hypothetical protein